MCIRTEATALGRVLSALLLGNNQTITQKFLDVLNRRNPFYQIRLLIQGECFRQILVRSVIQRIVQIQKLSVAGFVIGTQTTTSQIVGTHSDPCLIRIPDDENLMDYVRKQPLFNSQYRRWKFIAVCSAVDDDVKARYDSQKSKGKKGLVAEIDNYEVYALTWDDVFQSFDLRHAFLLDKLKMDEEAIAAEIAQTAGDEKSKDTADALTALVAN